MPILDLIILVIFLLAVIFGLTYNLYAKSKTFNKTELELLEAKTKAERLASDWEKIFSNKVKEFDDFKNKASKEISELERKLAEALKTKQNSNNSAAKKDVITSHSLGLVQSPQKEVKVAKIEDSEVSANKKGMVKSDIISASSLFGDD